MKRCSLILIFIASICIQLVACKKFELSGNNSAKALIKLDINFGHGFQLPELSLSVEAGPQKDYSGLGRIFNLKIGLCAFRVFAISHIKGGVLFNISAPSSPLLRVSNGTQALKDLKSINANMTHVSFTGTDKDNNSVTESAWCSALSSLSSDKYNEYIVLIELSGNVPPNFKLTSMWSFMIQRALQGRLNEHIGHPELLKEHIGHGWIRQIKSRHLNQNLPRQLKSRHLHQKPKENS